MKKIIYSLFIFMLSNSVYGQITLENTYTFINSSSSDFIHVAKLSAGEKFVFEDRVNRQISIYNINHSLLKTINLPLVTNSNFDLYNVSDHLFNSDNNIEIAFQYYIGSVSSPYIQTDQK